jgi:hypothetical protein
MSHFLDRLNHFSLPKESFSGEHGVTTGEDRTWEDAYRNRWAHDKIVRSTHGVNCTGSCSWKIYVKGGIVGLAGGMGGFVLPIMFGALMDLTGIRSSAFMLMYGVVWVSLIWMYWTEVRRTELMGAKSKAFSLQG